MFWGASICILAAEIVLGMLYRKGGTSKKGGYSRFPPKNRLGKGLESLLGRGVGGGWGLVGRVGLGCKLTRITSLYQVASCRHIASLFGLRAASWASCRGVRSFLWPRYFVLEMMEIWSCTLCQQRYYFCKNPKWLCLQPTFRMSRKIHWKCALSWRFRGHEIASHLRT